MPPHLDCLLVAALLELVHKSDFGIGDRGVFTVSFPCLFLGGIVRTGLNKGNLNSVAVVNDIRFHCWYCIRSPRRCQLDPNQGIHFEVLRPVLVLPVAVPLNEPDAAPERRQLRLVTERTPFHATH